MADINVSSPGSDEASLRSAFQAILKNWRVVGASGVAVPLTGTTSETALATVAIPAGAMGANGLLRVTAHFTYTNSANNKTLRVRLGSGLSGTSLMSITNTTTAQALYSIRVHNRNSQASQVVAQPTGIDSTTSASAGTATVDTSAAVDLVISGALASAAETITLESYTVEVLYQA